MSEEKRKQARTQGKYKSEARLSKRNSDGNKHINSTAADEGVSPLKYEDSSDYTFDQLEEVAKPEEIKGRVELVLSKTEHGESKIIYEPQFLHPDEGDDYFDRLYQSINWNTKNIVIHGVEYPQPRLVAWFGPFPYSYSGTTLEPAEMPDVVLEIKDKVEKVLACNGMEATFNSVLINLYRDGKDSVAWHSDDELMLGISPTIASVSLGEVRKFEIRPKKRNFDDQSPANQTCKYFVHLTHGSLIVMTGSMQDDWQHRVPKEYHDKEARINLTFRTVYPLEKPPGYVPAKEINIETEKIQSYGQNISSKTSNNEFKLDDEHFPSLQKDVISAKPKLTFDSHKNPNSSLKKNTATEEYWDNEISDNKQDIECAIVTHKNTSTVFNRKDEDYKSNKFNNTKPTEKGVCEVVSVYDNVKMPFDNKTISKKLWCDEHNSSINGFEKSNVVEERFEMKCNKSVNHSTMNEIQAINFYKKSDRNKVCDREASLTSEKSNLASKNPVKRALNADAKEFVPTNIKSNEVSKYSDLELEDLISYDINSLQGKDLQAHAQSLKMQISERFHCINRFDRKELEFLLAITDGSQVDKNQRLISIRICRLVQNSFLKYHQPSYSLPSDDRSTRYRSYENQSYYSDKGKRYPNNNRRF